VQSVVRILYSSTTDFTDGNRVRRSLLRGHRPRQTPTPLTHRHPRTDKGLRSDPASIGNHNRLGHQIKTHLRKIMTPRAQKTAEGL